MFSKEWKLALTCVLAVTALTACQKDKKKNKEATIQFQGLWVNAEAYDRLRGIGPMMGPEAERFCIATIMNEPRRRNLGIIRSRMNGQLMLDAWFIHGNGDVYQYDAFNNSGRQGFRAPNYRVGRITGANYDRNNNTGYSSFSATTYGSPFAGNRGFLVLDNNNSFLSVSSAGGSNGYSYGSSRENYVRASEAELNSMSAVLATCDEFLDFNDGWGRGRRGGPRGPGGPVLVPVDPGPGHGQCAPGQPCGPRVAPPAQPGQQLAPPNQLDK